MAPIMENNNGGVYKYKVAVIGSGNWGTVAAKIIASNTIKQGIFHDEVRMWVYEETFPTGEKLSETINQKHENCKYLPGIDLGSNVVADPELESTVKDADMLIFVTPHSYVNGICKRIIGKIRPEAKAVSLIKGMEVKKEGPCMISSLISDVLGINCCVLMGANIANEIAEEKLSEATIGYREDREVANRWAQLFATPYFLVSIVEDIEGVELCGTLKNVIAIAAGLVDGLGMGNNTKAAIIRIGLKEMRVFSKLLFPSVKDSTFFESCGVADLIASCYSGRNRKVAEAFARNGGKSLFKELEEGVLQGQKLQIKEKNIDYYFKREMFCPRARSRFVCRYSSGTSSGYKKPARSGVLSAQEVFEVLVDRGWEDRSPFFVAVHKICTMEAPPSSILKCGDVDSSYRPVHQPNHGF